MSVRQIGLLFGFFFSMFYIFKYGSVVPVKSNPLCTELNHLQIKAISEIGPMIRADQSDMPFDDKFKKILSDARQSADYMHIQKEIFVLKSQLKGKTCPAPSMSQMARLAANI